MLCVRALNDAKTHAQQGCAMQFSGITLSQTIFRKIELNNCFNIPQIVNEKYFTAKNTVVVQLFAIRRTNCSNLCISQNICYVRITDNKYVQTIYGH